ncbi:MAG: hypothetical protein ACOC7O_01060 [Thermoplasmatota archaeon]
MLPIDIKELILLHLEGFEEFKSEDEVPYKLTPKGITEAVGMSEGKPYTKINELEEDCFIEESERKITGLDRKRNVYFLTEKGLKRESDMWERIKDEKVILQKKGEEKLKLVDEKGIDAPDVITKKDMIKAILLRETGKLKDSEKLFYETIDKTKEMNKKYREAKLYYELGILKKKQDELSKSEEYIKKAIDMSKDMGMELLKEKSDELYNQVSIS